MPKTRLTPSDTKSIFGFIDLLTYGDCEWMRLVDSDSNEININIRELANIPQVKALIEVIEKSQSMIIGLDCYDFTPNLIHIAEQLFEDALAPFKKSTGDK